MILKLGFTFIVGAICAVAYIQEDPCRSYPGECKPKGECPAGSLSKINGKWSCPSSPDGIECCPTNGGGGGGYAQEEPCKSYPGVCKPKSDCPGGSLAQINGRWSCPSSPNGIECCPSNGGGGGGGGGGNSIVSAARSKIGTPYVWGGGDKNGPTKGGFDCSGLSQYSVYQGTGKGKTIPRTAQTQYDYGGCASVPLGSRQTGDLVFWGNGNGVYHVAIVSGANTIIHAPTTGQKVKEAGLFNQKELKPNVRRC